jgi:quinolinate synthase
MHTKTLEETYLAMREKLERLLPAAEIRHKAELAYEINCLKRERGAVILGHNYMEPALYHSVPDFVGDSLELARRAAQTECDPIVFCGVRFMAETAKILNPDRTVLLPAREAGCSLAASITAADVRSLRERYPDVPIVTYVNTYADVKAESDIVCTSANAAKIVRSLKSDTVIFLPDEYLARNVAEETGKTIVTLSERGVVPKPLPTSAMLSWCGRCEVHEKFAVSDIEQARSQFPDVVVLAHPECSPDVVHASDFSASTSKMVDYVKRSPAKHFLLLTECSMADNIIAEAHDKEILRSCSIRCPHMNEITLEETLAALRHTQYVIDVPEDIRVRARRAVDRMLAVQ